MRVFANDNFKPTRIKNGFSIVGLAEAIEVSKQAMGQVERRSNGISPQNAKKIVELFEVEFDDVFELVNKEENCHV